MTDFNFIQNRNVLSVAIELDFNFGTSAIELLAGSSNIITAIWASSDAGLRSGKVNVASFGPGTSLSIIDLKTKTLYDRYTIDLKGRSNNMLIREDIKDIS